jgi:branched-chain amino acid transport system ATP-binding protein
VSPRRGSDHDVLEVRDLTTNYGSISALRSVTVTVRAGEVIGLVGPNGAGKTTLVSTVAGILTPSAGTVTFDGQDVTGTSPDAMLRRGVALVPEHRRLFADLTVAENLKIGGVTVPRSDRAALMDEMVELFEVLGRKWDTAAGYLSGGEAQQLAIARALMSRPRLLMMDEPSLGLAPVLVDVVFDLIVRLREQGRTLLVVEQNATRMLAVSDRAYVLRSGELAATGSGEELLADGSLFETFVGGGGG